MARHSSEREINLDDNFLDDVISDTENIWPEVRMVQGQPCCYWSNGGIKSMNLTVEKN